MDAISIAGHPCRRMSARCPSYSVFCNVLDHVLAFYDSDEVLKKVPVAEAVQPGDGNGNQATRCALACTQHV